jgi:hypothetical protein
LPVICGWILQKKSYVPAWLNVMPPDLLLARIGVVQASSLPLIVAVWPVESLFVHVMVSPTLAFTVAGSNAKFAILTETAPAASDGAHGAAAAEAGALADAGSLAAADALADAGSLAAGALAGVSLCAAAVGALVAAVPPHAATANIATMVAERILVRDMVVSSTLRARSSLGYVGDYAGAGRLVS